MAKSGFKVFDSDMHIMEPPDLWERYIGHNFSERAAGHAAHRRHTPSRPEL